MNQFIIQIYFLAAQDFTNPIESDTVSALIVYIVDKWVFPVGGLIAVAFLVYGGIQYITAGGQDDKIKTAVRTITGAVIGLIIIFAAVAIRNTVFQAIGAQNYIT